MHPAFQHVAHRPWALPAGRWAWRQSWHDLLFAHWPIPARVLQPLVPQGLRVQEFDGTSWLGVVPFRMSGVMRRPFPDLPWVSAFPELNVRIYVEPEGEGPGKQGVWFLSLDASNRLAVWAARRFFHLPYFHARMSLGGLPDRVSYRSSRRPAPSGLEFAAEYEPVSEPYFARAGTLEHWLTERYCLYARTPLGKLLCTEIHHPPWSLQKARASIARNNLLQPHGLAVEGEPPVLHFSRRLDVVVWQPREIENAEQLRTRG